MCSVVSPIWLIFRLSRIFQLSIINTLPLLPSLRKNCSQSPQTTSLHNHFSLKHFNTHFHNPQLIPPLLSSTAHIPAVVPSSPSLLVSPATRILPPRTPAPPSIPATLHATPLPYMKHSHRISRFRRHRRGVMLPITDRSASRRRVMRAVGSKIAIVAIGERNRSDVVGAHETEREEALRPAASQNDALVECEEPLDVLREEVFNGEELSGKMRAGADGEEGGRVNAMIVGGGEIERDREETASLVCA